MGGIIIKRDFERNRVFATQSLVKDGFFVQKFFVKIANDDLEAGIMLSQIVYWFTPNAEGRTKLRVKHEGVFWLAKKDEDWYDEICLTARRCRRAMNILIENDLVEKKLFKFNAVPTTHFRLTDKFVSLYNQYLSDLAQKINDENNNEIQTKDRDQD